MRHKTHWCEHKYNSSRYTKDVCVLQFDLVADTDNNLTNIMEYCSCPNLWLSRGGCKRWVGLKGRCRLPKNRNAIEPLPSGLYPRILYKEHPPCCSHQGKIPDSHEVPAEHTDFATRRPPMYPKHRCWSHHTPQTWASRIYWRPLMWCRK